ncbi:MAG: hypothetical protein RIG68_15060 [Imperialibacter sp.]|uniref:hypothetical protein n=1 Tax=Imperialibacter sp. TaxID=2038411 RepID=UPI0032ED054E
MRRFLKKVSIGVLIVILAAFGMDLLISTDSPEMADLLFAKREYFEKNKSKYDVVTFGSSLVQMHHSPAVFDEITGLKSFNFGVGGMFGNEKFNIFNSMLREGYFDDTKYVIYEMGRLVDFEQMDRKIESMRGRFYFTFSDFVLLTRLIVTADGNREGKIDHFKKAVSYFFKSRLKVSPIESYFISRSLDEVENNGFNALALDTASMKDVGMWALAQEKRLAEKRIEQSRSIRKKFEAEDFLIDAYAELANRCSERGITIVFLISPKSLSVSRYEENSYLISIKEHLSERFHFIDLSNPAEYPGFFDVQNSVSTNHMNLNGAILFSEKLGEKFNEVVLGN